MLEDFEHLLKSNPGQAGTGLVFLVLPSPALGGPTPPGPAPAASPHRAGAPAPAPARHLPADLTRAGQDLLGWAAKNRTPGSRHSSASPEEGWALTAPSALALLPPRQPRPLRAAPAASSRWLLLSSRSAWAAWPCWASSPATPSHRGSPRGDLPSQARALQLSLLNCLRCLLATPVGRDVNSDEKPHTSGSSSGVWGKGQSQT